MGMYHGCGDTPVSYQLFHGRQFNAIHHQKAGECVPQAVNLDNIRASVLSGSLGTQSDNEHPRRRHVWFERLPYIRAG
jgi:hypothetical protein